MSKLALGTVQLGLNYGLSNFNGQVSFNEAKKIINLLKVNKIDTIDTAASYGNSEKVLGEIGVKNFKIITKTSDINQGVEVVIQQFHESLKNLNVSSVEALLVHNFDNINNQKFDSLYTELCSLKKNNYIKKIGFSVYTAEQVDFLLNNIDFDIIQLPVNVFDNRLIKGGHLAKLKNKKIEIHSRSAFLQGLLLNFNYLGNFFNKWEYQFNEYQEIVKASNLSLLEYALNFVINIKEIDKVIVGVDSESQLKEIFRIKTNKDFLKGYPINDVNLLNPSLWKI